MNKIKTIKYLFLLIFIFTLYSAIYERYVVLYPEEEVYLDNLPSEFDGFRIAILSDIHYGKLDPMFWIEYSLKKIDDKNIDIIVGLGDYVKKRNFDEELISIYPILNKLKAKYGVYLVNGNHDHWANDKLARSLLENSPYNIEGKTKFISKGKDKILLGGIGDYWENQFGVDKILNDDDSSYFKLILAHNPDSSNIEHNQNVDIFISGHTHGGQVRIPFIKYSPILPVSDKNFDKGLKENRFGEKVFISAGLGWSILPIRFSCQAEIPIIILRKRKKTIEDNN
jgi:uncharacterized protein